MYYVKNWKIITNKPGKKMEKQAKSPEQTEDYNFFVSKVDEEALEKEKGALEEIGRRSSIFRRWIGYFKFTGPGWLQSALTLGAATSGSAIMAGAMFGYELIWVVPLGKFFGIIVLAAIGYQVCFTGERPYKVFWEKLHPAMAVFWGINVLLASVIWQFPQYSMGTNVVKDMLDVVHINAYNLIGTIIIVLVFLVISTKICWSYGKGKRKSVLMFERTLKYLVWGLVFALLIVVIKTGIDWSKAFKGLFFLSIPNDYNGIMIILGLLGASIGVNTTFLYPYVILARRWAKEHNKLKDFDLAASMFIPSVIAPSLLLIAVATTGITGEKGLSAIQIAHTFNELGLGLTTSRIIFSAGILGMCVSTMILEMLIAGFVLSEMIGFAPSGWKFKVSTSLANVGILGAFVSLPFWVPVATSAFNLIMTPIAFIAFFVLQNRRDYLGKNINKGVRGYIWNFAMLVAVFINALGMAGYIVNKFFM